MKNKNTNNNPETNIQDIKKKKKKGDIIYNTIRYIVLLIAAGVFTYASYNLTKAYLEYKVGDDVYEGINDMFNQPVDNNGNVISGDGTVEVVSDKKKWVWDYDLLLDKNPDAKGWIRQEGTRIQYPILQGTDNEYYLTHTVDRTYNKNGSIFIDYRIKEGLNAQNSIIYGHNMWSDSMFGTLEKYTKSKEYWDQNPSFHVYIGKKHYIYYVFASFEAAAQNDNVYQYAFVSDEEFEAWQKEVRARSVYQTDTVGNLTKDNTILTMSTCTTRNDQSRRVVVLCVRGEEIVD